MLHNAGADALHQLLLGELAVFEEGIKKGFIGFSHRLHQLHAPFIGLGLHLGRNVLLGDVGTEIIVVDEGLVAHQVDDSLEIAFRPDRQLDGDGVGLQPVFDLVVDLQEIGAGAVHLVDEHDPGNVVAVCLTPDGLRLGLNATHGAEHGDNAIEHAHGALNFDGEIDVPGGVNDVDAVVFPAGGNCRRGDGDAALPLLLHPVSDGSAVMDLAHLVDHT